MRKLEAARRRKGGAEKTGGDSSDEFGGGEPGRRDSRTPAKSIKKRGTKGSGSDRSSIASQGCRKSKDEASDCEEAKQ